MQGQCFTNREAVKRKGGMKLWSIVSFKAPDSSSASSHKILTQNQKGDLGVATDHGIIINMKQKRIIYLTSGIGLAALFLMLCFTSPTEIGPLGVLLFFTTLYVSFFGIMTLLLRAFKRLAFKQEVLKRKDYLYSAVLAFGPIMLLMARSFGAVNLWTGTLIIAFLALAEFLVYKRI